MIDGGQPKNQTGRTPDQGSAGRADCSRAQDVQTQGRRQPEAGVHKKEADMSLAEMRRKGSWAVRFYGRDKLPALRGRDGEPTRFALSAHAWGERVPRTVADARKIAAKGRRLLRRYEKEKSKRAKS